MHAHVGWYRHRYLHSRSRYTYPIVFADHLWSVVFKHFCHELSFALVPNCKQDRNEATCLLPHDSYLRSTKNQYSPLLCWSEKIFWGVAAWRRSRTSPSNQEGFFFSRSPSNPLFPPAPPPPPPPQLVKQIPRHRTPRCLNSRSSQISARLRIHTWSDKTGWSSRWNRAF